MRVSAARAVADIVERQGGAYTELLPRVTKTLRDAWLDSSKGLSSHYGDRLLFSMVCRFLILIYAGALAALNCLGIRVAKEVSLLFLAGVDQFHLFSYQVVLPHLENYLQTLVNCFKTADGGGRTQVKIKWWQHVAYEGLNVLHSKKH